MKIITIILTCLLLVDAYNPGWVISLNTTAIENHKQFIANYIIDLLNDV